MGAAGAVPELSFQARLWELPDRLGSAWPDTTSLIAAVTVGVYLMYLVKPMPVNILGAFRMLVFISCVLIACAGLPLGLDNSGLMVWGQQIQQFGLLGTAVMQAIEWHRHPPS